MTKSLIVLTTLSSHFSASQLLDQIVEQAVAVGKEPFLVLGPTSPYDLQGTEHCNRIGWVTFNKPASDAAQNFTSISATDLLEVDLFIKTNEQRGDASKTVLAGDFLDNVMVVAPLDSFTIFYGGLTAYLKEQRKTAIFLLRENMHDARKVAIVKRYGHLA